MKKHYNHDQDNLKKEAFNWGLTFRFRGLACDHHGAWRMVASRQAWSRSNSSDLMSYLHVGGRHRDRDWAWCELLKLQISPPVISSKATSKTSQNSFTSPGAKHSNTQLIEAILILSTTDCFMSLLLRSRENRC